MVGFFQLGFNSLPILLLSIVRMHTQLLYYNMQWLPLCDLPFFHCLFASQLIDTNARTKSSYCARIEFNTMDYLVNLS